MTGSASSPQSPLIFVGERASISPIPSGSGEATRSSTTGSGSPEDQGRSLSALPEQVVSAPPDSVSPYMVDTLRPALGKLVRIRLTSAGGTGIPPMVIDLIGEKAYLAMSGWSTRRPSTVGT